MYCVLSHVRDQLKQYLQQLIFNIISGQLTNRKKYLKMQIMKEHRNTDRLEKETNEEASQRLSSD